MVELNKELVLKTGSPFRQTTAYTWYLKLFDLVKERAEVFNLIFDAGFQNKYLELVNEIVLYNPDISFDEKYLRLLWVGGVINCLGCWLGGGMSESVEDMARFCQSNLTAWQSR